MEQKPFGETTLTTETIQMPMRFPGQYADLESGFSYNYFRDYDPGLERYVPSDPIGLRGGATNFVYANSDPIHFIDPKGTFGFFGVSIGFVTSATSAFQASIAAGKTSEEALKVAAIFGVVGATAGGFVGPVGIKESTALGAAFSGSTNIITSIRLTGTIDPISQIKTTLSGSINAAIGNIAAFRLSLKAFQMSKNYGSAIALGSGAGSSLPAL